MEYLRNIEDADGKTIRSARYDGGEYVLLIFADDTALLIRAQNGHDGCDADIEVDREAPSDLRAQRELGLITNDEYNALIQKRADDSARLRELAERRQLRELAEKYGIPK